MIKQLTLMFIAGIFLSLIIKSHQLGLMYESEQSFFYIIGYLIGCSFALICISILLAAIPRIVYWALKIKRPPKLLILCWSVWILIIISLALSQLYDTATHQEPTEVKSNSDDSSAAQKVYSLVSNSVYFIKSQNADEIASGGAVAVSTEYLATNCHIIINPKNISVSIDNQVKPAQLYSAHNDLCILSVQGTTLKPVNMRRAKSVEIGEDAYAVGNPAKIKKTISNGIISNKLNNNGLIILQTNASISPGSSGGGLFDHNGNLIGITTSSSASENAQNINFALPTEMIEAAILEPTIDSMMTDNTTTTAAKSSKADPAPSASDYQVIGTFGSDKIVLAYWDHLCYILIPGRYSPKMVNSVAVWIPSNPDSLLLLSRVTSIEGVFRFLKWIDTEKNVDVQDSKSYIFYGTKLERLGIILVNDTKQPAYVASREKPYTEVLVTEDSLVGQFYNYSHSDYDGLTSITFGLSGFTDALDSYNQNCAPKP